MFFVIILHNILLHVKIGDTAIFCENIVSIVSAVFVLDPVLFLECNFVELIIQVEVCETNV
jgi:hypothetical protein